MSTATDTKPAPESLDDARAQADAIRADEPPAKAKRVRKPRTRKPRAAGADTAPRAVRPTSLKAQLKDTITTIGTMVLFLSPADGQAIIAGAPAQADALDALAKKNPAVRRALEGLLTASVYGQLIAAFAPTVLTIAANHGKVPPVVASLAGAAMAPPAAPEPDANGGGALDLAALATMAAGMAGGDGAPFGRIVGLG